MDAGSLLFFSILAAYVASPSSSAQQALRDAYLRQSGIQDNLNRTAKYLERRELSNEARVYLGYTAFISKTVMDKRIQFEWRFP